MKLPSANDVMLQLAENNLVAIPVYDEEYLFKYYINGNWYEDEAGTIPWSSSLI